MILGAAPLAVRYSKAKARAVKANCWVGSGLQSWAMVGKPFIVSGDDCTKALRRRRNTQGAPLVALQSWQQLRSAGAAQSILPAVPARFGWQLPFRMQGSTYGQQAPPSFVLLPFRWLSPHLLTSGFSVSFERMLRAFASNWTARRDCRERSGTVPTLPYVSTSWTLDWCEAQRQPMFYLNQARSGYRPFHGPLWCFVSTTYIARMASIVCASRHVCLEPQVPPFSYMH